MKPWVNSLWSFAKGRNQSFADVPLSRRLLYSTSVLKKSTKFTWKHLHWSLIFNKVAGSGVYNFIEKRLQHRYFPVKFANSLRTPFYRVPPGVCFWCAGQGFGNLNPKYIDSLYYQLFTGIFCNIHWSCISFGIILSESSLIFS